MRRFLAIGTDCRVKLKGQRARVDLPGAMLWCPEGSPWPKCSLLFADFDPKDAPYTKDDDEVRDWFGRGFEPRLGSVVLPPKSLDAWEKLGEATCVYYERDGRHAGRFHHPFGKPRLWNFFRRGQAFLYGRGELRRLDLGEKCIVDSRGIVGP